MKDTWMLNTHSILFLQIEENIRLRLFWVLLQKYFDSNKLNEILDCI